MRSMWSGHVPGYVVGPTEVAAVMMPATMESPMHHEYAEIYLWAARKAVEAHYGADSQAAKSAAEVSRTTDDDFLSPNGQYHWQYSDLVHDIRRRVIKHSTWKSGRGKNTRTTVSPTGSHDATPCPNNVSVHKPTLRRPTPRKVVVEQLDIF